MLRLKERDEICVGSFSSYTTRDLDISCRRFAGNKKEMNKTLNRTCRAIVLLSVILTAFFSKVSLSGVDFKILHDETVLFVKYTQGL